MPSETAILIKELAHPILLVDDEEIVLVALRDTLRREGYQVVSSPHAVHALSILKEQKFSVVITDQQMPLVSGLEFLSQVKEIQPDAIRILITAVLSLSTIIDAVNKGEIFRFVVKPWLREELLATVKQAVQRYETAASKARLLAVTLARNDELVQQNQELRDQIEKLAALRAEDLRESPAGNLRQA